MRPTAILVLAAAGLVAAQSTDQFNATSGCGSQIDDIIANCLGTQTAQLNACETNDWACMCEQQNNVLTCYNNCPSDPRKPAADSQKVSWCGAAKAANPSSTTSSRASVVAATSMSGAAAAATGTMTGTSTASQQAATNSMPGSSQATESSAAIANGVYPGALAAAVGLAAFL